MLSFFDKYNHAGYSQNGEQGIIYEAVRRIKPEPVAVEFGAPRKAYYSNCYFLLSLDWAVYYFDDDPKEGGIIKRTITPENINQLPDCSVLSIDTDGNDYALWEAYKGTPAIVVIEINSGFIPGMENNDQNGASFSTMLSLGKSKDYFLLCHTGNMIFVRNEYRRLFPEIDKDPVKEPEYYYRSWFRFSHLEWREEKR